MLNKRLFLTGLRGTGLNGVNRPTEKHSTPLSLTETTLFYSFSGLTDLLTDYSFSGLSAYIKALTNRLSFTAG
jgi:hypothetical protein